jgi:hypothetical protein
MTETAKGLPSVPEGQQPVDRSRRYRLVAGVVGFCLVTSAAFTSVAAFGLLSPLFSTMVTTYVEACISLSAATTLAYITGSVVDYNGGIGGILTPRKAPTIVYATPDPAADDGKAKG